MSEHVRETFVRLLQHAVSMPGGSRVADYLGADPWGDVEEFRRLIYRPLHRDPSSAADATTTAAVTVEAEDVDAIRTVLDGLGESFAGGVPWVELSESERRATERLLARLASDG